jgi:hypothetical protein
MGFGGVEFTWVFHQAEAFGFLVDWFQRFIEFLRPNSVRVFHCHNSGSYSGKLIKGIRINSSGREALLNAGIARRSWKVAQFMDSLFSLLREREEQKRKWTEYTISLGAKLADAANQLGISREALYSLYRRKRIRATLVRERGGIGFLVVPKDEMERLKEHNQ